MRKPCLLPTTLGLLFTVAVGLAFAKQEPRPAGTQQGKTVLVLQGGLLIDGTGGPSLQGPVIIISDGKI